MALRIDVAHALKQGAANSSGDRSRRRVRDALLAVEIAFSLVLVTGAGFFVRGLLQMGRRDLGWNPDHVLIGVISLPWTKYATDESCRPFWTNLKAMLVSAPGVQSAALSSWDPVFGGSPGFASVETPATARAGPKFPARLDLADPDYLATTGLHLLAGRWIAESDRQGTPAVAVINESVARTYWPDSSPIGATIDQYRGDHYDRLEVVGVVADTHPPWDYAKYFPESEVYGSVAQFIGHGGRIVLRCAGDPAALVRPLRLAIAKIAPDIAVNNFWPARTEMALFGENLVTINYGVSFYACFGLLLTALGIYGLVARIIHQRTREIGIRMALGADSAQVVRMILWRAFALALAGAAVGAVGGFATLRICSAQFAGYPDPDWLWFAWSIAGMLGLALLACYVPSRRAARIDPILALRTE
jgi:predicted permease